jgi:hypothetical protein
LAHATVVATAASKIKALAVEPDMRRHGIATALLSGCTDLYDRLGCFMQYGSFRAGSGLGAFYRARGFDLVPRKEGIDLYVFTGVQSYIGADGDEQLFVRWRRWELLCRVGSDRRSAACSRNGAILVRMPITVPA